MNRFREQVEVVSLLTCRVKKILRFQPGRKRAVPDIQAFFLHPDREINAGELRHHDIGDEQIGSIRTSALQGVQRIRE